MKLLKLFTLLITTGLIACKGKENKNIITDKTSVEKSTESKNKSSNLGEKVSGPEGITFERQNFEDMGTIELPSGADWKKEGNKLIHEKWNMIIVVQSHSADIIGIERDYLDSYNDVNIRDAEGWQRGQEDLITLDGLSAARTQGNFNNGDPFVTRDYLFFSKTKAAIVQTRVVEKNKSKLAPVADYIAASFKK